MMRTHIAIVGFILLLSAGSSAAAEPAFGGIVPALLQEDFRIMRSALEQAHGGIYRYASKREMDRVFDQAYRQIQRPMTDLEFWQLAAPVVARIKCGHTALWLPKETTARLMTNIPALPLAVRIFNDRPYVYRDLSNMGSSLEGTEILSINKIPAKTLVQKMKTFVTGDGDSMSAKSYRVGHYGNFPIFLYALKIESPFELVYRKRDGAKATATVPGLPFDRQNAIWQGHEPDPSTNAEIKFLDEGKTAVLTIRHWYKYADPARKLTFSDFLEQSFARIRREGTQTLIIDVRDNDGGLDAPGKELFAYLWDEPFYYDEQLLCNGREFDFFRYDHNAKPIPSDIVEAAADGKFRLVKHPNLGLQQPTEPHFGGAVYALMNGGSFSTSCEFLSMLHYHKRAKFIGEEAAGGYYGCTAGQFVHVVLPNSKVVLRFGLVTYYQAVKGYRHRNRSVLPDYPIRQSISDLMNGTDRNMELALSLARGKK